MLKIAFLFVLSGIAFIKAPCQVGITESTPGFAKDLEKLIVINSTTEGVHNFAGSGILEDVGKCGRTGILAWGEHSRCFN